MSIRLGFLGNGNMGFAILKGLVDKGLLQPAETAVYDPYKPAMERAEALGCVIFDNEISLTENSPILLAAVKPQQARQLLEKIGPTAGGKLLISIVAGYDVSTIRSALAGEEGCVSADAEDSAPKADGAQIRILRVMPNTPAMVGAGAFGLDAGTDATEEEKKLADQWFSALGLTEWVDESLFAAITGLSGSGPAYVSMFIEALADGGVRFGLKRNIALRLAEQTVYGTAKLLLDEGYHPAQMKDMVCSPAGTTIEGVQALEDGAFRSAVMHAVEAGTVKAQNM